MRRLRNEMEAAGIPIENSKGECGSRPGRDQRPLRRSARNGRPARHPEERRQGDRRPAWARPSPSWRSTITASPAIPATSTIRCGAPTARRRCSSTRRRPWGLSKLGQQWAAGQIKYATEFTWFLAPYINSYKRFQVGPSRRPRSSGADDNRTAGFRLCGEGTKAIRMECRIGGADLNPYLAFAALIAAGLAGIDEKLELQKPFVGDAYQASRTAGNPEDAARRDRNAWRSRRCCSAALGDDVIDHYVHTARLGAVRIRPPHHRLGAAPRVREVLKDSQRCDML